MRRWVTRLFVVAAVLAGAATMRTQLVHLLTRSTRTWVGAPRG